MNNQYMKLCMELAQKAVGQVSPNPLVGSVIVKDGKIVATGYHHRPGTNHAELNAIEQAPAGSLEGSTLYCNLEPCCHTNKRTPPCAQRIIKEKIAKVVISNLDPNPQVSGKSVEMMRAHGIQVEVGLMQEEGARLNEIFFTNMKHQRAFIHLKLAQTLDGKIATTQGHSKWITGEKSRELVHHQRLSCDAIMVGAGTARSDDPRLTVRLGEEERPKRRLIFTQSGVLPSQLQLFSDQYKHHTSLVVPENISTRPQWDHILCPILPSGEMDLISLGQRLFQQYSITSVYVEGGKQLHTLFLKQQAWDRLTVFIAPKIFGDGIGAVGDLQIQQATEAMQLNSPQWQQVGEDLMITTTRN